MHPARVTVRRKLQRAGVTLFFADLAPCLVGIEACATAHYWARVICRSGHQVRLIPPAYVGPYVRRSKNDAAEAAAICEAVGRPNMRFVPVKTLGQQGALSQHRVRDLLVRQRTMLVNALRGHLAEFGIVGPLGRHWLPELEQAMLIAGAPTVPALAREALQTLIVALRSLDRRIEALEAAMMREHRANAGSRRLATIPGIGPITATVRPLRTINRSSGLARQFGHGP
jgi:transposase